MITQPKIESWNQKIDGEQHMKDFMGRGTTDGGRGSRGGVIKRVGKSVVKSYQRLEVLKRSWLKEEKLGDVKNRGNQKGPGRFGGHNLSPSRFRGSVTGS